MKSIHHFLQGLFGRFRGKNNGDDDISKKMPISPATGLASVGFNNDFYQFTTYSIGMLGYAEPDVEPRHLPPDADDEALGAALRLTLGGSKRVSVSEFHQIFSSRKIQQFSERRNKTIMKRYGYKTKGAMWREMKNCSVSEIDGVIEIQPMHHKSLDGYSARKGGPQPLNIPMTVSNSEIGGCLRAAFDFCTSSVP